MDDRICVFCGNPVDWSVTRLCCSGCFNKKTISNAASGETGRCVFCGNPVGEHPACDWYSCCPDCLVAQYGIDPKKDRPHPLAVMVCLLAPPFGFLLSLYRWKEWPKKSRWYFGLTITGLVFWLLLLL